MVAVEGAQTILSLFRESIDAPRESSQRFGRTPQSGRGSGTVSAHPIRPKRCKADLRCRGEYAQRSSHASPGLHSSARKRISISAAPPTSKPLACRARLRLGPSEAVRRQDTRLCLPASPACARHQNPHERRAQRTGWPSRDGRETKSNTSRRRDTKCIF